LVCFSALPIEIVESVFVSCLRNGGGREEEERKSDGRRRRVAIWFAHGVFGGESEVRSGFGLETTPLYSLLTKRMLLHYEFVDSKLVLSCESVILLFLTLSCFYS
jgi:hypothetical protein